MADNKVPVYFVGYPNMRRRPITTIKGRVYEAPWGPEGPRIGEAIMVPESDVNELIKKNEYYVRNKGTFYAYTVDPNAAAIAVRRKTQGIADAPVQPNLSPEDILSSMSPQELAAYLQSRGLMPAQPDQTDTESGGGSQTEAKSRSTRKDKSEGDTK